MPYGVLSSVPNRCRRRNPEIESFLRNSSLASNYRQLEGVYVKKLLDIVSNFPARNGHIVWQELYDNRGPVRRDTVVQVWKGGHLLKSGAFWPS